MKITGENKWYYPGALKKVLDSSTGSCYTDIR